MLSRDMPRSRLTELPQRPSPRAPPSLRTSSSSDSDPIHHRSRTDRSPKLSTGRSPRGTQSDPVNQKKLGTRIADLESQLGQAQHELKSLKDQLVSAEAAKKEAQEQLDKKSRKVKKVSDQVGVQVKKKQSASDECETSDDTQKETDVFEVPMAMESKSGVVSSHVDGDEVEQKSSDGLALKNNEAKLLKSTLEERKNEVEVICGENNELKIQLSEKSVKISSLESEIEELTLRLKKMDQELEKSRTNEARMIEKLEATEKANGELENEMKRLRIQTEQWRKAADAAASVLAGEVEMNERRISERCVSMDKHYNNAFEHVGGGGGYVGSPGLTDDSDDVFGGGKRKVSGIRMFGDLWKKKGHK